MREEGGCLRFRARVRAREIFLICSLTESCEGLAIVRTVDQKAGIVDFFVTSSMRRDFEEYLAGLSRETQISWDGPVEALVGDLGGPV